MPPQLRAPWVLTEAGLVGIVAAIKEGRITFQRILTYTLNAIIKKVVTVLFLVAGLIMTGHAILTPMLMVIVMVAGDFLSMSVIGDRQRAPVAEAEHLAHWRGYRGWGHFRQLHARLLHRSTGGGKIRTASRRGRAADSGVYRIGLRKPRDNLCFSGTAASVEFPTESLARNLVSPRYHNCFDARSARHRNGTRPGVDRRRYTCGCDVFRIRSRSDKACGICLSRHCPKKADYRRRRGKEVQANLHVTAGRGETYSIRHDACDQALERSGIKT